MSRTYGRSAALRHSNPATHLSYHSELHFGLFHFPITLVVNFTVQGNHFPWDIAPAIDFENCRYGSARTTCAQHRQQSVFWA